LGQVDHFWQTQENSGSKVKDAGEMGKDRVMKNLVFTAKVFAL
jgi:hypothetical protein